MYEHNWGYLCICLCGIKRERVGLEMTREMKMEKEGKKRDEIFSIYSSCLAHRNAAFDSILLHAHAHSCNEMSMYT